MVEYKHKIGFKGTILVEPKPQEPTKHQYDYDVATVFGFLQRFGLEKEVKVNIEVDHAMLAGHSFEHEIATATALGILGSIDANRNDYQSGWDTDQFPNNAPELVAGAVSHPEGRRPRHRRVQFRRQGAPPVDRPGRSALRPYRRPRRFARAALLAAARLIEDGKYDALLAERYAGWDTPEALAMLAPGATLEGDRRTRRADRARSEAALRPAGVAGEPGQPVLMSGHSPPAAQRLR